MKYLLLFFIFPYISYCIETEQKHCCNKRNITLKKPDLTSSHFRNDKRLQELQQNLKKAENAYNVRLNELKKSQQLKTERAYKISQQLYNLNLRRMEEFKNN